MNEIVFVKNEGYVNEIIPHLYLGDIETSQNELLLNKLCIKHIINLTISDNKYKKWLGIQYIDIPIDDSKNVDISQYFDESRKWIDNAISRHENILVHCVCGVSRSVAIIISYLMKMINGMSLKDAFLHVKGIRTNQYTLPNIGFFKQLQMFEKNEKNEISMTLQDYMKMRQNVKC